MPILILCQKQLKKRLADHDPGAKLQPKIIYDQETGIPLEVYFDPPEIISIEPGAHIDPEGHNLYNPDTEGLSLISASLDIQGNLQRLHKVLDEKYYTARALEHSRKLLMLYLAGKQRGNMYIDLKCTVYRA